MSSPKQPTYQSNFQIGEIYCRDRSCETDMYLAVSEKALLTVSNSQRKSSRNRTPHLLTPRPHSPYFHKYDVSVQNLCRAWGISTMQLDFLTAKFLAPSPEGRKLPEEDVPMWLQTLMGTEARSRQLRVGRTRIQE